MLRSNLRGAIFVLAVNPRPQLVQLQSAAREIPKNAILVIGAEDAKFKDQPEDGFFRHAGYANSGADGIAFDRAANDFGALFGSEAVHTSIMREPPTHINAFRKIDQKSLGGTASFGPVRPACFGRKGSCFTALFGGHASGPSNPATRPTTPAKFGHDAGNLGRTRARLWGIGKHFNLVVSKLVKIGFGCLARSFWVRHTLPVSQGCVVGSSLPELI